jgi:hypothetical protein
MSFVAAGTFVIGAEAALALGAIGTGVIGGALVGAGTGALVNGLSGRSVLNGALIGGAIGGTAGGLGGAFLGAEVVGGSLGEMAVADASSQLAAGIPASPARRRGTMGDFSPPVTTHKIRRARLITGYVNVIRRRFW